MMRTEAEAKETRCCGPEGCGWSYQPPLHDQSWPHKPSPEIYGPRFCIGSACMAWRWAGAVPSIKSVEHSVKTETAEPPRPHEVPPDWVWYGYDAADEIYEAFWGEPMEHAAARRKGACGLVADDALMAIAHSIEARR